MSLATTFTSTISLMLLSVLSCIKYARISADTFNHLRENSEMTSSNSKVPLTYNIANIITGVTRTEVKCV